MKLRFSKTPPLFWLLLISAIVRALLAAFVCLGNDEAYYYTYALYPDLSHFDHPPMVGWMIQLFTLNLHFSSELFVRLPAMIAGTLNTWLIYLIGKQIRDELTGWYAALLYTASVYGSIIVGVMILPDSPQSIFWLAGLLFLIKALPGETALRMHRNQFLLASVFIGLAMISKYTTAFLWFGMVLYIVIYNRKWLKTKEFYLAHLIILVLFLPVLIWNFQNNFISFSFHTARVEPIPGIINFNSFLTEIVGELLYANPVNVLLITLSLVTFFFVDKIKKPEALKILVLCGLPLIMTFLAASLFRATLPHWTGLGYLTLLPAAALWLRDKQKKVARNFLVISLSLTIAIVLFSVMQIATGIIPVEKITKQVGIKGADDYSLEVYGWRQMRWDFIPLADKYEANGLMPAGAPIVSYRWFPAANYSYYAARGTNRFVMAAGDTAAIHKYAWINAIQGGFKLNGDAWYITSSRDFRHPRSLPALYFEKILLPDTIPIRRCGKTVYSFYVYRMKNLQSKR